MTMYLEVRRHDGINIDLPWGIASKHITVLQLLPGLPIRHRIAINQHCLFAPLPPHFDSEDKDSHIKQFGL